MSYRKVKEGGQKFEHSGTMLIEPQKRIPEIEEEFFDDKNMEIPMTYFECPKCHNRLVSCNCNYIYKNYYCDRCYWKHENHLHPILPGVQTNSIKTNVPNTQSNINNNSILARNIRK